MSDTENPSGKKSRKQKTKKTWAESKQELKKIWEDYKRDTKRGWQITQNEMRKNASESGWNKMTLFEKIGSVITLIGVLGTLGLVLFFVGLMLFLPKSKPPEIKFAPGNRVIEDFIVYEKNYGKDWPFGYHDSARVICEVRDYGTAKNLPLAVVDVGGFWYGLNYAAINEGDYNKAQARPPRIKHGTDVRISYDGLIDMEKRALALPACAALKK